MFSKSFLANAEGTRGMMVPQQEVLPPLAMSERSYLQGLVDEPSGRSVFNMIAGVQRDFRARRATTDFLDKVRDQFFAHTQARLEVELSGELAHMVEELRHAMTMVQLEHYAQEQDYAMQRTMQMRLSAAKEFRDFGQRLIEIGYPEEQVERAIGNTVTNLLSVAGATIVHMEGLDAFAAAARPQSTGAERMGERDGVIRSELR